MQVAPQVSKQLKTEDLRKLRNLKKTPEMLGIKGKCQAGKPKQKF